MKPETRLALEEIAGTRLAGRVIGPIELGVDPYPVDIRGVYVVCDMTGRCAYVGKVSSDYDSNRLASRLAEHLRDPLKREIFSWLYVLPLKPSTPNRLVEQTEGWVSLHLRPYYGQRAPRTRR